MSASEHVVRISFDASPLAAELRRWQAALGDAADRIEASAPTEADRLMQAAGFDKPADRTARVYDVFGPACDRCGRSSTGGAAGGGLPPEHWCDEHRPDDYALGFWDDDPDGPAPNDDGLDAWVPQVGDRVTVHCPHWPGLDDGTPATVAQVFNDIRQAAVTVESTVRVVVAPSAEFTVRLGELRPLEEQQPASVGPVLLADEAEAIGCQCADDRAERQLVVDQVRERLSQYPESAPVITVYRDMFGGRA